jgi:hypothetical protein
MTGKDRACYTQYMAKRKRCEACNKFIPAEVHILARSRTPYDKRDPDGHDAKYCSKTCRNTANIRRARKGEALPRETYLEKVRA